MSNRLIVTRDKESLYNIYSCSIAGNFKADSLTKRYCILKLELNVLLLSNSHYYNQCCKNRSNRPILIAINR